MKLKMLWRPYPRFKPRDEGYYLCKVDDTMMVLYFDSIGKGKWVDKSRQSVFDGYKVYQSGRAAIEEHRVFTDSLCDLTDKVKSWRVI